MALRLQTTWPNEMNHRRNLAVALNGVLDGRTNSAGSFTLAEGATSTTVADVRCGTNTVILWMATSAAAAGMLSSMYVSERPAEEFTITHGTAPAGATFEYALYGTGRSNG